jgi:acetolactate synthase-1/2/3 large subunit
MMTPTTSFAAHADTSAKASKSKNPVSLGIRTLGGDAYGSVKPLPTNTGHPPTEALPRELQETPMTHHGTAFAQLPHTGAHLLLQSMVCEGVDTFFGLPGGVILSIYEGLHAYPQLNHVLVRHEQGAVHMAEGYAKATGKVGVAMATSGPGATNTVTAIADAFYDSIPIVVITGNVPSTLLGNDAFQEADIVSMTRNCTKHNVLVRHVDELQQALKEAFYIARSGRPGPVLVDIPKDVLLASASTPLPYDEVTISLPGYQPQKAAQAWTQTDVDAMLTMLQEADRPMVLCGGGIIHADATEEMLALIEHFNLPFAMTLMGLSGMPMNHPQNVGYSGMHGHYWGNIAVAKSDVLLVVGSRLNDRQTGKAGTFARNAKVIHIDLDPTSLNKNVATHYAIQGDIKAVLAQALQTIATKEIPQANYQDWLKTIEGFKARRPTPMYETQKGQPITPQFAISRVFAMLDAVAGEHAIVTTEVGQHQMWSAQRFNLQGKRSWITSGGLGTMGFGFPAAIGVKAARPEATVVDIAGDGSFQMTLQELATAVEAKLPVKVVIINNGYLGMVRQWQDKLFERKSEVRMTGPDYVKLAEAYGCAGYRITCPSELDATLEEAFRITDRPVIVDLVVDEEVDVYPWVEAGKANEEMLTDPSIATMG